MLVRARRHHLAEMARKLPGAFFSETASVSFLQVLRKKTWPCILDTTSVPHHCSPANGSSISYLKWGHSSRGSYPALPQRISATHS